MVDRSIRDRRARKSILALWQALFGLMQSKDWADISVQMIADRADVARSTFYAHFQTKQDLLDAGFALLGGNLQAQVLAMPLRPGHLGTLDWLLAHVSDSRDFMQRAKGTAAGQVIQARFRQSIAGLLTAELSRAGRKVEAGTIVFLAGGIFAVVEDWVTKGCPDDRDSLSRDLCARVLAYTPA